MKKRVYLSPLTLLEKVFVNENTLSFNCIKYFFCVCDFHSSSASESEESELTTVCVFVSVVDMNEKRISPRMYKK